MIPLLQAASRLAVNAAKPRLLLISDSTKLPLAGNAISKRWSGHNVMDVTPSNFSWKYFKNWLHFYVMITAIPLSIVSLIVNIRANPELSEIPEGYEPRHWEYYKHPITRFIARYLFTTDELDNEMFMSVMQDESERNLVKKIAYDVDKTMQFYSDHRSSYFRPFFADYYRRGRDYGYFGQNFVNSDDSRLLEDAYNPASTPVPVEGYKV